MKEQPVIVDTSALISLLSDTDSLHDEAVALAENLRELRRPLIIPAEVLAETLTVLRPRLGNRATMTIGNELLTSADIAVIPTPREVLELTLTKLQRQTGNASYIDCLVMVTADQYRTRSVFGFDETFRKNGYQLPGHGARDEAA